MTRREIVETALKGIGMIRVSGDTTEPIMPYLLADVMYQVFDKQINNLSLRHELKQMRKIWNSRYHAFDKPIFSEFKKEDYVELTDLMDDIYECLSDDINQLQEKIESIIEGVDSPETKSVIASLIICKILAQYADCAYQRVYYTVSKIPGATIQKSTSNKDLCYLGDLAYNMSKKYIRQQAHISLSFDNIDLDDILNSMAKKIYQWLSEN